MSGMHETRSANISMAKKVRKILSFSLVVGACGTESCVKLYARTTLSSVIEYRDSNEPSVLITPNNEQLILVSH